MNNHPGHTPPTSGSHHGPHPGPPGPPGQHMTGKVYPHDQPMVFNPSNPNAPPIYPCGACHKEVHDNDQAILCESGCNFWFHRICTGLSEPAFHMLTQEVYAEWVCDKCLATKNIPLIKLKSWTRFWCLYLLSNICIVAYALDQMIWLWMWMCFMLCWWCNLCYKFYNVLKLKFFLKLWSRTLCLADISLKDNAKEWLLNTCIAIIWITIVGIVNILNVW